MVHAPFLRGNLLARSPSKRGVNYAGQHEGGEKPFYRVEPHEWQFVPGTDDLCVADVSERLNDGDEVSFLPLSLFVTKNFVTDDSLRLVRMVSCSGFLPNSPERSKIL